MLKNIEQLPENTIPQIKTKLRQTCENYSKIRVPYNYKQVINNLAKNRNIVILKQDKGREVVIMDKTKCQEKYLALLNRNQFVKLNRDATKQIETKIQRVLKKIKANISLQEYSRLYPTGSSPGKFYGTTKIDSMEKLPIRPIVSNVNTLSY